MYDKEQEPFSNPLAPPSTQPSIERRDSSQSNCAEHQPLTNDDFRKLMMTPRVGLSSQLSTNSSITASVRSSDTSRGSRPKSVLKQELNENRKKKKKFYATLKKQEDDTLSELAKRYRDRARERRDGANPDYHQESESSITATTAAYRAVAPDLKSGLDAAERRKQVIQESKFLGGDMEHTHLVKGLDYALLQKVKAEITIKEKEEKETKEDEDEELLNDEESNANRKGSHVLSDIQTESDDPFAIKSKFANNIIQILFNKQLPERNELFLAGRMAYLVDLGNYYKTIFFEQR
jgi:IK cytokine